MAGAYSLPFTYIFGLMLILCGPMLPLPHMS